MVLTNYVSFGVVKGRVFVTLLGASRLQYIYAKLRVT